MSRPTDGQTSEWILCRVESCDVGWRFDPWRRDIVLQERREHEWEEHGYVAPS